MDHSFKLVMNYWAGFHISCNMLTAQNIWAIVKIILKIRSVVYQPIKTELVSFQLGGVRRGRKASKINKHLIFHTWKMGLITFLMEESGFIKKSQSNTHIVKVYMPSFYLRVFAARCLFWRNKVCYKYFTFPLNLFLFTMLPMSQ